jgi:hypothetical protein
MSQWSSQTWMTIVPVPPSENGLAEPSSSLAHVHFVKYIPFGME